ncbi:polyadenylate-binding 8-like [Olea europaea subsp. europaea]|uniref:Polyadenylate-binding 8-like n=1 Tax=Olea europaea subsp. europaea TaxID=158383 RepID=A0A8S0QE14_OLEEU|nr:polyadenylate-binding 8-like [Olea europaea subsp. europaea]
MGRCRCRHGGGNTVANAVSRCPFSFQSTENVVGPSPPSLLYADAPVLMWGRRIGQMPHPQNRGLCWAKICKLLEMDQTKVLHLLESPDALKAKVAEAMKVLRNVSQQEASNPTEQLADLALN